jgi:hypothetical protein
VNHEQPDRAFGRLKQKRSAHFSFAKREMGASSRSHADAFFMAHFFVLILPVFSTKSLYIGFWGSRIRNVGMGFPYLFQNCTTEYRFRCIKREFHEAKRFALLEVKYPV